MRRVDLRRTSLLIGFAVILVPLAARAQFVGPENTSQACQDQQDNDGDGYTDCADQDCGNFTFCVALGRALTPVIPRLSDTCCEASSPHRRPPGGDGLAGAALRASL